MSTANEAFIQLDQALKLRGDVATGGQAKAAIQGGEVRVNGEVETRRGRKLRIGDRVVVTSASPAIEFTVDEALLTRDADAE